MAYIAVVVLHIKVSFLSFELKDAVMTIGAMICGPVYAIVMSLITSLIEFFTISDTGIYGLIMNVIASVAFTLPASLIYKYKRDIAGALIGTVTSVFSMTAVMLIANLIVTPYYTGMPVGAVASMIPTLLLPFNLTKAMLNAGIVLILYKPISKALKSAKLVSRTNEKDAGKVSYNMQTVIAAAANALIVVSVAVMVIVLDGKFTFGIDIPWN